MKLTESGEVLPFDSGRPDACAEHWPHLAAPS